MTKDIFMIPFSVCRNHIPIRRFKNRTVFIIALLSLILFSGSISASVYSDIEILSSTDRSISFIAKIPEPLDHIVFGDQDSIYNLIVPILIGIPPNSRPVITVQSARNIKPVQIPQGIDINTNYSNLVEISEIKNIRNHRIAQVDIYPYNESGCYGAVNVTIEFQVTGNRVIENSSPSDNDFFTGIFESSLLNYSEFKTWGVERKLKSVKKASAHPFDNNVAWYKIANSSEGILRVSRDDLAAAGLPAITISSDDIHIYYGDGEPLPVYNSDPRPDFAEIPIKIYDGDDGVFEDTDYLIFFAEGANRWNYDSGMSPEFVKNRYTNLNYYWLCVDNSSTGLRIGSVDGQPNGTEDSIITRTRFYTRVEQDNLLRVHSDGHVYDYYNWYWTNNSQATFYQSLPNAIYNLNSPESTMVHIRAVSFSSFNTFLSVNAVPATRISVAGNDIYYYTSQFKPDQLNSISLTLNGVSSGPYFDYCEIEYPGSLSPNNDRLDFSVNGFAGSGRISVENDFIGTPVIFDITNPSNAIEITNANSASTIDFRSEFQTNERRRFYLSHSSRFLTPQSIERKVLNKFRDEIVRADMIIITAKQFENSSSLLEYIQYREETESETNPSFNIKMVAFEDLVDEFAYGQYDPTAIRDYLKFAYENYISPAPSMVLLIGDGHYDIADNLNTGTMNYIPPYIFELDGSSSDENYVYLGDFGLLDSDTSYIPGENYGYDMMISRWPVRSNSEIAGIVNKIESYESSSSYGIWKSTVTLVADDEYVDRASTYEGMDHVIQTENLEKNHLPSKYIRRKIYLWDYPHNSEAFKPDVNNAIVNAINDGTILINYVGHGNPDTWAHEHVFYRTIDLQKLSNSDKLSLFYAASCSIGLFDDPKKEGMGEELFRQETGGAVGVFAASRLVFSTVNSQFNRKVYDFLFDDSNNLSVGQAFFATKLFRQYSGSIPYPNSNDRKYIYFGDPLLHLAIPHKQIEFDEAPTLFTALSPHYFAGRVLNQNGLTDSEFDGNLDILIYDSELNIVHRGENDDSLAYSKIGPMIYRGVVPVNAGQFDFTFIVPLDVGYGGQGAKIFAYAYSDEIDGLGFLDSIEISSEIGNSDDSLGPQIGYYFGESDNFVSGDQISSSSTMSVILSDTTGLNLTGNAGHRITLTIDNDLENIVNLTDLFRYNPGSYTSGSLSYNIDSLSEGLHNFRIKAWDNVNNASVAEFAVDVIGSETLMLTDLLNYPNPMGESTIFSFFLTSDAEKVSLDIFTLAGRKIFNHKKYGVPSGFFEFYSWNGKDLDGDRVATGVYIYKVTASASNSGEVVESFGKVAVIN